MKVFRKINGLTDIPNFNVSKQPLFNRAGLQIPNLWSLVRDDTEQHIGTCSGMYRPIQLEEMVETIIEATKDIDSDIEHIGFAENKTGSSLVIQSKIGDIGVDSDPVDGYLYTVIDHRGKHSNKIIPSSIRIACTNAFHLIRMETKNIDVPVLRHSMSFSDRVLAFRANIKHNIEFTKNFSTIAERLRKEKFTKREMEQMVNVINPVKQPPTTKSIKKFDNIMSKFSNGIGVEGSTKWDALNAITEYESHQKTSATKFIRNLSMSTLSSRAYAYLKAA
ncbi:MAG: DUF932 domain-containing protein [Minisyncoccia bacterium]